MDKKTVAWIKTTFPGLFACVVKSTLLTRLVTNMDWCRYVYCLGTGKPYFGTVHLAGQTWEERKPWMRQLMMTEASRRESPIDVLEVGSWAGNSAILWADAAQACGREVTVLCVDAWEPYIPVEQQDSTNVATALMNMDLAKQRIFKLFMHNIKAAGHAKRIFPLKAASDQVLPRLKAASFDVIYVDGDHRYNQFSRDLNHAALLLREGGVLCGDDFDAPLGGIDAVHAREHREDNVTVDPRTGKTYHPGICLGLADFFGTTVSAYNGFWAMRKTAHGWQPVHLITSCLSTHA